MQELFLIREFYRNDKKNNPQPPSKMKYFKMPNIDEILYITATGVLAGLAQWLKSMRDGLSMLRAALEGAVSFFVGLGIGSVMIMHYHLDPVLCCGISGLFGLLGRPILQVLEVLIKTVGETYTKKLK